MDKSLKAPYVIPKDKLISEDEIKKMAAKSTKVTDEIKVIIIRIIERKVILKKRSFEYNFY